MNRLKKGFFTLLIAVLAVCMGAFAWFNSRPAKVAFAAETENGIDINTAFEWQGVKSSDNGTPDDGAEPFTLSDGPIYVYSPVNNPTSITEKRYSATLLSDDEINSDYTLTQVINENNAVAMNRGGEITAIVKVNAEYADVITVKYKDLELNGQPVTPGTNYADTAGSHQALAQLTISNDSDFEFYNYDTSSSGILISDDHKSAFITKDWYITEVGNALIVDETPDEENPVEQVTPWRINGWTYNNLEEAHKAPVLTYGNSAEVTFALKGANVTFGAIPLADFDTYVNASMPTGTYSLTFTVPELTVDGIVHNGYNLTYNFTVSPSAFLNEWREDISSKLGGTIEYKAAKDEHGQYTFQLYGKDADLAVWSYFDDASKSFNPERTGIWAETEYINYYSDGYELTYNLEIQSNNSYQNYDAMQAIGTPAAPATYKVYYQLEAKNYESLTNIMNESDRREYTFTVVIYDIIDLPESEYSYIGTEQLIPATSLYSVVKTDANDTYTERGEHTVKLVSNDADHYRFLNAQNEAVNEIEFTYTISRVSNETIKFQFSGWEWNSYDSSKLPIWTTAYEDETDPDFYTYYIESDDDHIQYELSKFAEAPVGYYTIYCTAKGYVSGDAENTAQYSYNTLRYEYPFLITKANNTWVVTPDVIQWQYQGFDSDTHRFIAEARYSDATDQVLFSVATDEKGEHLVPGLENFTTNSENKITDAQVIINLNGLKAGTYYLISVLNGTVNYDGINTEDRNKTEPHRFDVLVADNSWNKVPSIETWITGKYDSETNAIVAEARFGEAHYRIVSADDEEKVIYDDSLGINELSSAPVGSYILTVTVADDINGNFKGISEFLQFRIFEKPGLPWWATVIIVVAALGVAALVLYILHQKGVLQLLSGKIIIAMRTKATVDATIAAIRANKVAADAKKTVAAARLQDANEARKRKKEELKNMTLEEQAAALEEQAREAAEKAEKFDKKATRTQKRADRLKKQLESEQSIASDNTETASENTSGENTDNNQE